jgi:glycosyl-4,4'-diaponeurosporenoate acyltransferase
MQIIYPPVEVMLLSYIIVWPVIQLSAAIICNHIDDRFFNPEKWILRSRKWEKGGKIYNRIFHIKKWKHLLPDGARVHKKGFEKRNLKSSDPEYIKAFIAETGRAEIIHWCQLLPFWVFGLWSPAIAVWLMLAYAVIVNVPCIIAQRYNRPRLIRLYHLAIRRNQENKGETWQ